MLNIGNNETNEIYLGVDEIDSIYLGNIEIFSGRLKKMLDIKGEPTAMYTDLDNGYLYIATKIEETTYTAYINVYEIDCYKNRISNTRLIFQHATIQDGIIVNNATEAKSDWVATLRRVNVGNKNYLFLISYDTTIVVYNLNADIVWRSTKLATGGVSSSVTHYIGYDGAVVCGYKLGYGADYYLGAYWYGTDAKNSISVSDLYDSIFWNESEDVYYCFQGYKNYYSKVYVQWGSRISININSTISISDRFAGSLGGLYDNNRCYGIASSNGKLAKFDVTTNQFTYTSETNITNMPSQDNDQNFIGVLQSDTNILKINKSALNVEKTFKTTRLTTKNILIQPSVNGVYVVGKNKTQTGYLLYYCNIK